MRRSEQRRPGNPRDVLSPAPAVKESPRKMMRMSGRGIEDEKGLRRRGERDCGGMGRRVGFRSLVGIAIVFGFGFG